MSDFSNDPSPFKDGLESLLPLIRLVIDAKACSKRAEELIELSTQAIEATAAAAQAQADLQRKAADQEAALAKRRAELDAYYDQAVARDNEARRRLGEHITRALLNHAGLLGGFDERIQQLPSLAEAMAIISSPRDAQINSDTMAIVDREPVFAVESMPGPPGSTLTRTVRRGAEPRVS